MSDQLKQAIVLSLKPSYLLLGLLVTIAILSLVSTNLVFVEKSPLILALKWGLQLLIIATTAYYSLRDALLWLPGSWQKLVVNVQGELLLTNKQGQTFKPTLAHHSFVYPQLILLNFSKPPGRLFKFGLPVCVLLADSSHEKQHRQLRLWLKWWPFDQKEDIQNTAIKSGYHGQ